MGWSVAELDQSKTLSSISNEEARLDNCRTTLSKLVAERERFEQTMLEKLRKYDNEIVNITNSIYAGEKFVEECKNHLKDFE